MKNGELTTKLSGSKLAYQNCQDIINVYAKHINYVSNRVEKVSEI